MVWPAGRRRMRRDASPELKLFPKLGYLPHLPPPHSHHSTPLVPDGLPQTATRLSSGSWAASQAEADS